MPDASAPPPTSARPRLSPRAAAVGLQLLLWGLLTGFYFAWNSRANYHFDTPIWPVVLMEMGFAVLLFNVLVYLIIPRWLLRGRYLLALLGGLGLVVAYLLWTYAGVHLIIARLPPTSDLRQNYLAFFPRGLWYYLTSPAELYNQALEMLATMLFPILVSFLAYAFIVDRRRLALERNRLRLELSYVKAQINPRLLFHTLGTLQHLTRARDPQAGDVVLHLADLLRYTLYETDAERVPLDRELDFLADYLALERLRYPRAVITHEVAGTPTDQQLAPLLLLPFYEHLLAGLDAAAGPVAVTSHVQVGAATLTGTLRRTAAGTLPAYAAHPTLEAARRQWQLQYPARHTLQVREAAGLVEVYFQVEL